MTKPAATAVVPNAFHSYVRDAVGITFLHTFAKNTPKEVAAAAAHARWWIRYAKRRSALGKYVDHKGNRLEAPCGLTKFIVEYYTDESALLP